MPRLVHRKPKYRRHASGQAVVSIGGRDIYLGAHGQPASRREYGRLIAEWEANHRMLPAKITGGDYSIAELIAAYWEFAQAYFEPGEGKSAGERTSVKMALRELKKLYADAEVKDFGPLSLRAVRDAMVKMDWSRRYINAQVNRLRRVFKWGVERELVAADVWQALCAIAPLREGKTDAREILPVGTIDDVYVEAVLPFLNRHVQAMVQLQRLTGMRPGELVIMRMADIDKKNPKLWEYRPTEHKTKGRGHERTIYLNTAAQKILKPFPQLEPADFIFSPREAEQERRDALTKVRKTPITQGNRPGTARSRKPRRAPGARYTTDSYRRAITRACELANEWERGGKVVANDAQLIPRFFPHNIRHSTATKLRAKHGLEAAQVILGHRTLSATQIYAERNVEKAKRIMLKGS
jgi:integrase